MSPRKMAKPLFVVGDFVFAKLRGYRAWPARVLQRFSNGNCNVFFYGTCNYARVPRRQICDFESNLDRLGTLRARSAGSNASFRGAMCHARNAFSNPSKDFGFYQLLAVLNGDCVNAEDLPMEYEVVTEAAAIAGKGDTVKTSDLPIEYAGDLAAIVDTGDVESKRQSVEADALPIECELENDPVDIFGTEDTEPDSVSIAEELQSQSDSDKPSDEINKNPDSAEEDSNNGDYNLDFDEIKEELLRNLYT
ncbi:uncharacterized protein Dana_GF18898 [Drosophila ananassae]|uniref:PWWP domain-containing protein n=1 Tax=Drosophila ananassae TaxID=7217 RepID=B3M0M4_DROAN|nr:putative oxidoreductase GLYR1 homolog [Drosophila ananassae]EDV44271.2 uncharacterized protein Dana_GF18898 [Drosophila ananassae]